jgi:hypothetical protein
MKLNGVTFHKTIILVFTTVGNNYHLGLILHYKQVSSYYRNTVRVSCQSLKFATNLTKQSNVILFGRSALHMTTTGPGHYMYDVTSASAFLTSNKKSLMLGGSLVTTAWRVLRLRMEETASRYEG